jgi:hypothetical protein
MWKPEVLTNGLLVDEGRGEGRGGKAIISEAQELNVHHL